MNIEAIKPVAWKHYTKPLERRLQHLEAKDYQNSFDKQEASALRHVLGTVTQPQRTWVGLEQSDMPDGEDPLFDHKYFIAGMVYADKVLKEKNT